MSYCDRCDKYNDNDVTINTEEYCFDAGYGSEYDNVYNKFIGNFKSEEEFKYYFPFDTICDDCITKLIFYKQLKLSQEYNINVPLYTDCCDKYVVDDVDDLLSVFKDCRYFPYVSQYYIEDIVTIPNIYEFIAYNLKSGKDFPKTNVICKECFNNKYKHTFTKEIDNHEKLHGIFYAHYTDDLYEKSSAIFFNLEKDNIFNIDVKYLDNDNLELRNIVLTSRNNMNNIKIELKQYISKRNLIIIRSKYYFPKDIFNLIINI